MRTAKPFWQPGLVLDYTPGSSEWVRGGIENAARCDSDKHQKTRALPRKVGCQSHQRTALFPVTI